MPPDSDAAKSDDELDEEAILATAMLAEEDINEFIEFVIQDPTGEAITQAPIHRAMHTHIDWCRARGVYAGIVAPFGHGKTEQVIVGRSLHELGKNPNQRLKVICNNFENATARVGVVASYIEKSAELRLVFPSLAPDPKQWGKEKLRVKRSFPGKDASLEAWGIMSGGIGGRADGMLFDDCCDIKDITEPQTREKKVKTFDLTWLSRLVPGGWALYIATVWHEKDLTHVLVKNPRWSFLWMAVSDDLERIDCTLFNADRSHPLAKQYAA